MRTLLIIWIAVWQSFAIRCLFKEANFSPHQWRQLLELASVLFLLPISISECIFLAHIVEVRMNSLSVSFWDRSSYSFFLTKLFKSAAYANSLDHLDCRNGALVVFINKNFISGTKFLCHQWRQLLVLACLLFLSIIWIIRLLCMAHSFEIRMNSLSVLWRLMFILLFFEEAVGILSLCNFFGSFGLQSGSNL